MKKLLTRSFWSSAFSIVGLVLAFFAVVFCFGIDGVREITAMQVVALGVASLACFKSGEFLADK